MPNDQNNETFEQARMKQIGTWIEQGRRIQPARRDHAQALADIMSVLNGHYTQYQNRKHAPAQALDQSAT